MKLLTHDKFTNLQQHVIDNEKLAFSCASFY